MYQGFEDHATKRSRPSPLSSRLSASAHSQPRLSASALGSQLSTLSALGSTKMGTIRGRSVLDFLRHRVGFAIRNDYPTRVEFWERAYQGSVGAVEWAQTGYHDLKEYDYDDATPKKPTTRRRSTWVDDVGRGKVLLVGSGTSPLGLDMWNAGWQDITSLDFSKAVIENREGADGFQWILGDARDLGKTFDHELFDAVIDKGTIDSIYLSGSKNHASDIERIVDGAAKVAKQGGTFITFSLTHPSYMLPILHTMNTSPNWDWPNSQVRRLPFVYMYLLPRRHASYRYPR